MTTFLQIDQDGLSPGEPGKSRTDGLAGGELVTLTDTGPESAAEFRLLWTPPGDTGAVSSLAQSEDPKVWAFAPTAARYGTYLVEDVGTGERRALVVRTPNRGLIIPALGERGDPSASLFAPGTGELADNNATDFSDPDLSALPFAAWWRAMHELIIDVDSAVVTPFSAVDSTLTIADDELGRAPIVGHIAIPAGGNQSTIVLIPSGALVTDVKGALPFMIHRRLTMSETAGSSTSILGLGDNGFVTGFPFNARLIDAWIYCTLASSSSSVQVFKNSTAGGNELTSVLSTASQGQIRNFDNQSRTVSAGDIILVRKNGAAFLSVQFEVTLVFIPA